MPYIKQEDRKPLRPHLYALAPLVQNGGDLNYCFYLLCRMYLEINGYFGIRIADCLAALEGTKQEFYCNEAVPYEDAKKKENGAV